MDSLNWRFTTRVLPWYEMRREGFTQKGNGFYKNVAVRNGCILKIQTSSWNRDQQFLNVEVSAPKLFYGNNVEMFSAADLPYLNDTVTDIVNQNTRIAFDANDAEITTFDAAHNWKTPSESVAHAYRDAMTVKTLPYLCRDICAKENGVDSVYWSNKSKEIVFYPKYAETKRLAKRGEVSAADLERSRGMIRLERRSKSARVVREQFEEFGYSNRAGEVVPHLLEITNETLKRDLRMLGLDNAIEIGANERDRLLSEACKDDALKLERLSGFLYLCERYGESNLVGQFDFNEKTLAKRKTELRQLGVGVATSAKNFTLPPLTIEAV